MSTIYFRNPRDWLRAGTRALATSPAGNVRPIGVDRGKEIIRGAVMAQLGPFKSDGRGEFDQQSLDAILQLAKNAPNGLKCRLAHPNESNDGIGKLLGRWKNPYMSSVGPRESEGAMVNNTVACVRGDLHLDSSAHKGEFDMAEWLMSAAENDPAAISASLVLQADEEYREDVLGRPLLDELGDQLPPLWRPTALHACDIVDTGDAVDGLLGKSLSTARLPNKILWQADGALDAHFAGKSREFTASHLRAYIDRYLNGRFGPEPSRTAKAAGAGRKPSPTRIVDHPRRHAG